MAEGASGGPMVEPCGVIDVQLPNVDVLMPDDVTEAVSRACAATAATGRASDGPLGPEWECALWVHPRTGGILHEVLDGVGSAFSRSKVGRRKPPTHLRAIRVVVGLTDAEGPSVAALRGLIVRLAEYEPALVRMIRVQCTRESREFCFRPQRRYFDAADHPGPDGPVYTCTELFPNRVHLVREGERLG